MQTRNFWLLHLLKNQQRVHIKVGFILAFMGLGWFISIFANCRFMSCDFFSDFVSQGSTPSYHQVQVFKQKQTTCFTKKPNHFHSKKHLPKNSPHFSPFYFLIPALKTVFFSPNGVGPPDSLVEDLRLGHGGV